MPDPEVRRLPAALDSPLARLDASRDELAKAWLLRLLERASLEEIERIQTDRVARELPQLIGGILSALGAAGSGAQIAGEAEARAARLAELRGAADTRPADVARDLSMLQSVLISALAAELRDGDPHVFVDAVERLAALFAGIQAAAVGHVVAARASEAAGPPGGADRGAGGSDPLTGLPGAGWLRERIEELLAMQRRYGQPFSLLLVDVVGLRRVNESRGEEAGNSALVALAGAIADGTRTVDAAVRIAGDEFCVVTPLQTASRAAVIAERLAASVEAIEPAEGLPLGVAVGVVSCPEHGEDATRLLELGDEAMYSAKAGGRRVAIATPDGDRRAGADHR